MKQVTQNEDGHYEFKERTMDAFFKSSDFKETENYLRGNHPALLSVKEILFCFTIDTNKILREYFESSPVVYGKEGYWQIDKKEKHITKAYLAFPEPIKKECTKHAPGVYQNTWNDTGPRRIIDAENFKCIHCGVMLEATWSEKK